MVLLTIYGNAIRFLYKKYNTLRYFVNIAHAFRETITFNQKHIFTNLLVA